MSTFKRIGITARHLAARPLTQQIACVLERGEIDTLILREKDLSAEDYLQLAKEIEPLCQKAGVEFICNERVSVARAMGHSCIQMGLSHFRQHDLSDFQEKWVSIHSEAELREAESLGATALIFGHVFETRCKLGLAARGLAALAKICAATPLPVYAIGGIEPEHEALLRKAAAAGACRMSSIMSLSCRPKDSL